MTSCRCFKCGDWWSMQTLHPEKFQIVSRWCPNCVPATFPRMGGQA